MFRRLITFTLTLTLVLSVSTIEAQSEKYGHVNFGNLMEQLPQTAEADKELEKYRDSLSEHHEMMVQEFEKRYGKYIEKVNQGEISQVDRKQREADFQKEQQKIVAFEQQIQQKVRQKRQKLLDPILSRLNQAIETVGEAGNYSAIFDTSMGAMLFAEDSKDVTASVKNELGLE